MKHMVVIATALIAMLVLLAPFGEADAKRLGGGRSFGSKPMYSQPYTANRSAVAQAPTQSQLQNQARRAQLAQRGGLWGMLGGLALGGIIGALLFGGAFEGIKLFDILLFAGVAFLLYYLFAVRRRGSAMAAAAPQDIPGPTEEAYQRVSAPQPTSRSFDTDLLFGSKAAPASSAGTVHEVPAGFDREHFMEGAKGAYRRLQDAWDKGDLADIRQFTTDQVFAEIQDQFQARSGVSRTEIFKLDGELLEAREVGGQMEASVLFDALMREVDSEGGEDARPYQVREVWNFVRPVQSARPTWFLDGIQQLDG
jgi:predicted lipid-binding transport protein (Tim44 family)